MALQRFSRESRIWSRMKHENIIPLFGFWRNFDAFNGIDLALSFVSPWMEQGNLSEFLKENPTTTLETRLSFVGFHISISSSSR